MKNKVYLMPITTCKHFENTISQKARKFKKVQAQKNREIKEINFTKIFFDQIAFFAISKMAKNQFLN